MLHGYFRCISEPTRATLIFAKLLEFLYPIGIAGFEAVLPIVGLFHKKAARRATYRSLPWPKRSRGRWIWVHAASVGEYEQARPIIEAWRTQEQGKVLLSFYSPSGIEQVAQDAADAIIMFPGDLKKPMEALLAHYNPEFALFVKAELWPVSLSVLEKAGIPSALVAFAPGRSKAWAGLGAAFWKKQLNRLSWISCQDSSAAHFLLQLGMESHRVHVDGNPRVDRLQGLIKEFPKDTNASKDPLWLIAGSTWPADEKLLFSALKKAPKWNLLCAPHQPEKAEVTQLLALGEKLGGAMAWSELSQSPMDKWPRVVVVDGLGELKRLYRFGSAAYVGGGFGRSIHSCLEPAAYGLPMAFGPKLGGSIEAQAFLEMGTASQVKDANDLLEWMQRMEATAVRKKDEQMLLGWFDEQSGAGTRVLERIKAHLK